MKKCPRCGRVYTDGAINFCLDDGELLGYLAADAPQTLMQNTPANSTDVGPATEFMPKPADTRETNWPHQASPISYQSPPQPMMQQSYAQYPVRVSPSQTLAFVSLGLGIGSMTIGWCCSLGLILSPAAIITGIISLVQIKKNPQTNGGRGFAIAGIAIGGVFLAMYLLFIIIYGIALILP